MNFETTLLNNLQKIAEEKGKEFDRELAEEKILEIKEFIEKLKIK